MFGKRTGQPGVAAPRRVEVGGTRRIDRSGHVGEQERQALMVDDLAAERRSLLAVGDRRVECRLGQPHGDGCDAEPPGVQRTEGDL